MPGITIERAPTREELSKWNRLLEEYRRASDALDACGLLLKNVYITTDFAINNGIAVNFDPSLETQYYKLREDFGLLTAAIRGVENHELGIRVGDDIDILRPPATSYEGLVIPVALGIIVLAAAVGTAIYQSRIATEIANQYRTLLFDTDQMFCSNPSSPLCQKWKQTKVEKKYVQNATLAETLKAGVAKVAGGLSLGLAIAVAGLLIWKFTK
ncbi:MAG: hypothetical protein PHD68_02175 [Rugosibacter sp.]|nr:hypothetical protein [Rugosibacter sp.]